MLRLNTLDEAVAIAKHHPGLTPYGINVEVRPVGDACNVQQRGKSGRSSWRE